MISTILWDNDGVLVDTERLYFEATRQVLKIFDVDLTHEEFTRLYLVDGVGTKALTEKRGLSEELSNQLRDRRNALYQHMLQEEELLIQDVRETLMTLERKYQMGIITSSRKSHFDTIHERTGILKHFAFFLTGDDYQKYKPDPEPYLLGIKKSGHKPEECIVVEDSPRGLESAHAAGLPCVIIRGPFTDNCDFSTADYILNTVGDLPDLLEKLNAEG